MASSSSPQVVIKKEAPEDDIKEYAETAMNELLGWYGYDKVDSRDTQGLNLHHFASQRSPSEPDSSCSASPPISESVPAGCVLCTWCQKLTSNKQLFALKTPAGQKAFCSEVCFTQCRRANFKRNKTCDWCRHVRHTVNYVDFQDGEHQLQFCSDKCLNQYKMNIFCKEAQAHLQMHPFLHEASEGASTGLITPDLWLRDCRSDSPHSDASTPPQPRLQTPEPPLVAAEGKTRRPSRPKRAPRASTVTSATSTGSSPRSGGSATPPKPPPPPPIMHPPPHPHHLLPPMPPEHHMVRPPFLPELMQRPPPPHMFDHHRFPHIRLPPPQSPIIHPRPPPPQPPMPHRFPLPPITIIVPYPIVIPIPLPIPIPIPLFPPKGADQPAGSPPAGSPAPASTPAAPSPPLPPPPPPPPPPPSAQGSDRPLRKRKRLTESVPDDEALPKRKFVPV